MKVVHLSFTDIAGGAARAAWRVHRSLDSVGINSAMFVGSAYSHGSDVTQYSPTAGLASGLRRRARRAVLRRDHMALMYRPAGTEPYWDDRTTNGSEVGVLAPAADVYHIHQITDFVDYAALPILSARAPIVWTLHETTPLTGGCPYPYECVGFTRQCGACPQLGSSDERDLSHAVWRRKQSHYSRIAPTRMHVVGPSQWIAEQARRSTLLNRFPVSVIPYALDTEIFRPMREARRLLDAFGVPPSARIVLFVAEHTNYLRKGFTLLDSALARLKDISDVALISLGRGEKPTLQSALPHIHLGTLTEDRMIAAVYSMADVFVIPSLEDNLPNTVLESMACGTPVVGFRVGGIPDMVREGENGLLVPRGDITGLASAIETLLTDESRRACMGAAGRRIAEREYNYRVQSERYLNLYSSLLNETAARGGGTADERI
jgi:glycosyltransferase involved in cell wall biosynthesis